MEQGVLHFGWRIWKTGIAVFSCLLFSRIFGGDPFYAAIAAVVCMKQSREDSWQAGFSRVIGTIIGGIVGMLMLYVFKYFEVTSSEWIHDFLVTLILLLLIKGTILLRADGSVVIACVVYCSLVLVSRGDATIVEYAVGRVFETLIGVVLAVLVNMLLPNHHLKAKEK